MVVILTLVGIWSLGGHGDGVFHSKLLLVDAAAYTNKTRISTTTNSTTTIKSSTLNPPTKLGAWEEPYPMPAKDCPDTVCSLVGPRSERFPSVDQRVKLYMSNWYHPPCSNYQDGFIRYAYHLQQQRQEEVDNTTSFPSLYIQEPRDRNLTINISHVLESIIEPDKAFFLEPRTLAECLQEKSTSTMTTTSHNPPNNTLTRVVALKNMNMYCVDVASLLLVAWDHVVNDPSQSQRNLPIVMQFGDLKHSHVYRFMNVPLFKKFRSASMDHTALEVVTAHTPVNQNDSCVNSIRPALSTVHGSAYLQPIVWKFATPRHFGLLDKVYREDTPWEEKINMAVFRGQLTGALGVHNKRLSAEENCARMKRCRLVYNHANSTLIHAKLTSTRKRMPDVLNGVDLLGSSVTIRSLLRFKGIIMLEGNDVASGLKWALLSQSVVLMPIPKHTSYAMEELLEPWIHYVPLNENATDVEEKMAWILENDERARLIAHRGSLWMQDLVFHPDAAHDDRLIQDEMMRRYARHFVHVTDDKNDEIQTSSM